MNHKYDCFTNDELEVIRRGISMDISEGTCENYDLGYDIIREIEVEQKERTTHTQNGSTKNVS